MIVVHWRCCTHAELYVGRTKAHLTVKFAVSPIEMIVVLYSTPLLMPRDVIRTVNSLPALTLCVVLTACARWSMM